MRLQPDDFFYPMTMKRGFITEHRLLMARHLKRCLLSWEIVHHRNGIKSDNRLENLRLIKGSADHTSFVLLQKENKYLQERIQQLEREITSLREGNENPTKQS